MNGTHHKLDEAIDRVAATMVAVDDDAGGLQAVLARLPERESTPWFLRLPVQAAAAIALLLVAFVWARPIDRQAMPAAVSPIAATAPPLGAAPMAVPVAEVLTSGFRLESLRSPDPGSPIPEDHERSLAPLGPLTAMAVASIALEALESPAPDVLAPLVLTDLPLASDSSSPRER